MDTDRIRELELALQCETAERRNAEALLRLQYRISDALRAVGKPMVVLTRILEALVDIESLDCGGIYTRDHTNGGLRLRVHCGLSQSFLDAAVYYPPDSPNALLANAGKPLYGRHSELAPEPGVSSIRAEGIRALAVIPVTHEGKVTALLNLGSHTSDEIPPRVRAMLEAVASQIADVVALMESDQELRERERDLETLFHSIEEFLFVLDGQGRILRVNRTVQERLGYTEEELAGQPVLMVHPPDRRDEAARIVGEMLAGTNKACPVPIMTKSGALIPVETRVMPGVWGGRPALFGVSRDITERERVALELRTERDFARLVMDTMAQGLTVTGGDGKFEYVNPAYAQMIGCPPENLLGRHPAEFTAPEFRAALADAHARRMSGKVTTYESSLIRIDGSRVPVVISGAPRWRAGMVVGAIAVITDMTEQRQAEEARLDLERRVLQAQKRSSLGTMAGGIAHHLNNLLTVIIGNLELAIGATDTAPGSVGYLHDAAMAARRAARISKMILTYVGQRLGGGEWMSLSSAVEKCVSHVRRGLPPNIRLDCEYPPEGPMVNFEPDELEQVVVNLVTNAVEAIGTAQGKISIKTGVQQENEPADSSREGGLAYIEISDTGHGMDPDTQARIFDPFFTTHTTGRGLGLAVTLGIVQSRNGMITVDSAPRHGTTIRVLLPVISEAVPKHG